MGRRKDLSKFERGMIVGARLLGAPVSQTSVLSGKSKTTVSRVFTEWRKSQKTTTDRSRCGRKRLVTDSVRQWLEKIVTSERTMTIAAITQTLNAGSEETVSARTVRRELRRMGFYCRVQLQKHHALDLSKFDRGVIVGARLAGASIVQTVNASGKSRTTVSRVFKEWRTSEKTGTDRSKCGRKRLLTDRERQWLEKIVSTERTQSSRVITETLNLASEQPVSARTVRRELQRMGFYSPVPPSLLKYNQDLKDKNEPKDDKANGKKLADENGEDGGSDEEYPGEVKDGEEEEGDEGLEGEKEDEDEVEEVEEEDEDDDDDEEEEEQPLPAAAHPTKRRGNEQETVGKKRQKTASSDS
ncbi:YTH domain-containing protein 1-like isoform X2 [Huso huso]|uniref:YTH domain-containing protein 1-like isoform X2 n=1 Tax=Huso huso TaxID=61971 RepID=A0ABR0YXV0_HUSHU